MSNNYVAPAQARHLRACMICSFVATQNRFIQEGCPNCDDILSYRGEPQTVGDCTSQVFEGLCHIADPSKSWVARWQRLDKFVPGMYAVKVVGILPEEAVDRLTSAGFPYIPRDGREPDDVER